MIEILNEQLTSIKGEIRGPPDTPYEGGRFQLDIKIPEQYPFQPPKVHTLHLLSTFYFGGTAFPHFNTPLGYLSFTDHGVNREGMLITNAMK